MLLNWNEFSFENRRIDYYKSSKILIENLYRACIDKKINKISFSRKN